MSEHFEIRGPHNTCGKPPPRSCDSIVHCTSEGACLFSGSPFVQPKRPSPVHAELRAPSGSINGDLAEELHKRYAMGMDKYGVSLDANTATISARLQHMKEELMDALCYVEWALREMKGRGL